MSHSPDTMCTTLPDVAPMAMGDTAPDAPGRSGLRLPAALLVATIGLSACGGPTAGAPAPSESSRSATAPASAGPVAGVSYDQYHDLESSACRPYFDPDQTDRVNAKLARCLPEHTGRVALVTYGTSMDVAQQVAAYMERGLPVVTGGTLAMRVEAVQASGAAEALHDASMGPDGCVKENDVRTYGSVAAQVAMPELREYDRVVSLTDERFCGSRNRGVADSAKGNGTAAEIIVPAAARGDTVEELGKTGIHEVTHTFNIGHDGSVSYKDESGGWTNLNGTGFAVRSQELDLYRQTRPEVSQYDSATDTHSVMGLHEGPLDRAVLNPLHMDMLRRPQIMTQAETPSGRTIGSKPQRFDVSDAVAGRYARLELETPIDLTDASHGLKPKTSFDTLAVVPDDPSEYGSGSGMIESATLYLADDSTGNVAALGKMFELGQGASTYTIVAGSQTVRIGFAAGGMTVQSVAA